jgi:glycosyltransferase involved in cell wall biosynthesis
MSVPRFSIVIPTCDRANLLAATLPACLLSSYANLEVVVSDNYSSAETEQVVRPFLTDARVRYVRTGQRLSMPDHWDFAWRHATGDFIIMNGDDDAFSPSLPAKLREVAQGLNAALMSWHVGLYFHPDWDRNEVNTLTFLMGHSRALIDVDPVSVFASYAKLDIPTVFPQGTRMCFSRKLAERALARIGKVFWGPYPDFSAPLLLLGLLENERYIYLDESLGYGGRSLRSNAAAIDKDAGSEHNQDRMRQFYNEFSEDIYPHQPLKVRSLWNGHGETVNLLRELLPEVFGQYQLDIAALIAGIECEFRGINIYNAHLGVEARMQFDRFIANQKPALVDAAMRKVEQAAAASLVAEERWSSRRAGRMQTVVRMLRKMNAAVNLLRRSWYKPNALTVLKAKLRRSTAQGVATADAGDERINVLYDGRMIRIPCGEMGCRNGTAVAAKLDEISQRFDPLSWANVEQFANGGWLRAMYISHATASPPILGDSKHRLVTVSLD